MRRQRPGERDGAVEGHGHVQVVLEHVQVVEAVGLVVGAAAAARGLERELRRVLREPEDGPRAGKGHVHAHGRGPEGHGVRVAREGLRHRIAGGRLRLVGLHLLRAVLEAREAVLPVAHDLEALGAVPGEALLAAVGVGGLFRGDLAHRAALVVQEALAVDQHRRRLARRRQGQRKGGVGDLDDVAARERERGLVRRGLEGGRGIQGEGLQEDVGRLPARLVPRGLRDAHAHDGVGERRHGHREGRELALGDLEAQAAAVERDRRGRDAVRGGRRGRAVRFAETSILARAELAAVHGAGGCE
mmetsp:Transcript_16278/g.48575  ORF Transcript_16278/g.48575 Transcript_16278/m.48575 type:complete len:302 (-) Transcript_16278:162-1067(-)